MPASPFFLLALMPIVATPATPKPSVAIFTYSHEQGTSASLAKLISDRAAQLLRDSDAFSRVITSSEMESLISSEAQRQAVSCDSTGCMQELADTLNADLIITGSVGKVGTSYLLNAKMLDAKAAVVRSSVGERYRGGTDEELLDHVEESVWLLLERAHLPHVLKKPTETVPPSAPTPSPAAASPSPGPAQTSRALAQPPEEEGGNGPNPVGLALAGVGGAGVLLGALLFPVLAVAAYALLGAVTLLALGGPSGGGQRGTVADVVGAGGAAAVMLLGTPVLLVSLGLGVFGVIKAVLL